MKFKPKYDCETLAILAKVTQEKIADDQRKFETACW